MASEQEGGKNDVPKKKTIIPEHHLFTYEEIDFLRGNLLGYYSLTKRILPWRVHCSLIDDASQRAYFTWVSEVMLQQTQVATVIDYYNRWIARWPTIKALSEATLDEVNEMWSGLGYYSRGRRLFESAKKLAAKTGKDSCQMPGTEKELMKELQGVGRYTACAIASIAYGHDTGVVDGNVQRVLSRLRIIGADTNTRETSQLFWHLANIIVDPDNPGDFNQALMELGALICTPKSPKCSDCPVKTICKAYARQKKCGKTEKKNRIEDAFLNSKGKHLFDYDTDDEDVIDLTFGMPQFYDDPVPASDDKKESPESENKETAEDTVPADVVEKKEIEGNKETEEKKETEENKENNSTGDNPVAEDKVEPKSEEEEKMETLEEKEVDDKIEPIELQVRPIVNRAESPNKGYKLDDIEDVPGCRFCLSPTSYQPWNPHLGVMNYPRKGIKKPPGVEHFISIVLEHDKKYLFSQRPNKGLLANMWEFPLAEMSGENEESNEVSIVRGDLKRRFGVIKGMAKPNLCGEVTHVFSHKYHIYRVYCVKLSTKLDVEKDSGGRKVSWWSEEEANKSAITSAIRKIMAIKNGFYSDAPGANYRIVKGGTGATSVTKPKKRKGKPETPEKGQQTIKGMMNKKSKREKK